MLNLAFESTIFVFLEPSKHICWICVVVSLGSSGKHGIHWAVFACRQCLHGNRFYLTTRIAQQSSRKFLCVSRVGFDMKWGIPLFLEALPAVIDLWLAKGQKRTNETSRLRSILLVDARYAWGTIRLQHQRFEAEVMLLQLRFDEVKRVLNHFHVDSFEWGYFKHVLGQAEYIGYGEMFPRLLLHRFQQFPQKEFIETGCIWHLWN